MVRRGWENEIRKGIIYRQPNFSGDMDGSESNFSEKIVKTRKPHECCVCGKEFPKRTEMVMQSVIIEGEGWGNCYICLPCIEEWLEEIGRVGVED